MKKQIEKQIAIAATLTAALAATSGAATVQITLNGNQITNSGGDELKTDVTGDGQSDINISSRYATVGNKLVRAFINGNQIYARFVEVFGPGYTSRTFLVDAQFATVGGVGTKFAIDPSPRNIKYLNPISFADLRINGGAVTDGFLEINSFNTSRTNQNLVLTRVIFDDASITRPTLTAADTGNTFPVFTPVPEVSSLALLALGAGGLLLRRQRNAA